MDWARRVAALGAGEILLTSMDGDGTQAGYDLALTRAVAQAVGSSDCLGWGRLYGSHRCSPRFRAGGRPGIGGFVGSLLHDGVLSVEQIKQDLQGTRFADQALRA